MRRRRMMTGIVAALALIAVVRHPTADIRIQTHDIGDPAPHRVQAALDLGIVAVRLLVTWTSNHLAGR